MFDLNSLVYARWLQWHISDSQFWKAGGKREPISRSRSEKIDKSVAVLQKQKKRPQNITGEYKKKLHLKPDFLTFSTQICCFINLLIQNPPQTQLFTERSGSDGVRSVNSITSIWSWFWFNETVAWIEFDVKSSGLQPCTEATCRGLI